MEPKLDVWGIPLYKEEYWLKNLHLRKKYVPKELRAGIKTESEHRKTVKYIEGYYKTHKKFPTDRMIFTHISKDHLKEDPKYYTKLKKAKL